MIDNIGRAFTYMFEDKDWLQKVLLGAAFVLLSFLIIPIPFLVGYNLEVMKNASEGKAVPLPNWDNLGDKFLLGLLYFLVGLIYAIPLMIINFLLSHIPCIGILASIILSIAVGLVVPYIGVQVARTRKIAPAFDFAGIIAFVSQNLMNLVIVVVLSFFVYLLSYLGFIALIIGIFFTMFYAQLVVGFLYGEVVRIAEQGSAAISVEDIPPAGGPSRGDHGGNEDATDDQGQRQQ